MKEKDIEQICKKLAQHFYNYVYEDRRGFIYTDKLVKYFDKFIDKEKINLSTITNKEYGEMFDWFLEYICEIIYEKSDKYIAYHSYYTLNIDYR